MRLPISGHNHRACALLGARAAAGLLVMASGLYDTAAFAATTPTAYFQYGSIVGVNNGLSMTRVPITSSSGLVTYYDVTVTFTVSAAGLLSTQATVVAKKSLTPITSHFQAGRYYAQGYDGTHFACGTLSYAVGTGGSTIWTWVEDIGVGQNYAPDQAVWQTVSPSPDVEARLTAAKVLIDPNDSFGLTEQGSSTGVFPSNGLLSAQAAPGTITLSSYTNGSTDEPESVGSIILDLTTSSVCPNPTP